MNIWAFIAIIILYAGGAINTWTLMRDDCLRNEFRTSWRMLGVILWPIISAVFACGVIYGVFDGWRPEKAVKPSQDKS